MLSQCCYKSAVFECERDSVIRPVFVVRSGDKLLSASQLRNESDNKSDVSLPSLFFMVRNQCIRPVSLFHYVPKGGLLLFLKVTSKVTKKM